MCLGVGMDKSLLLQISKCDVNLLTMITVKVNSLLIMLIGIRKNFMTSILIAKNLCVFCSA